MDPKDIRNMRMANNATVLHFTPSITPNRGTVLCSWNDDYVTWFVYRTETANGWDVKWEAEIGHYFYKDFFAAVDDYKERV